MAPFGISLCDRWSDSAFENDDSEPFFLVFESLRKIILVMDDFYFILFCCLYHQHSSPKFPTTSIFHAFLHMHSVFQWFDLGA